MRMIDLEKINTLGPIGHAKAAPGTWASVATAVVLLPLYYILPSSLEALLLIVILAGATASLALSWPSEDRSEIVIDEVAGQAIASFLLPDTMVGALIALALFRLFDITKPGLIGVCESLKPMWLAILADDLLAGFIAGLVGLLGYWVWSLVFFV